MRCFNCELTGFGLWQGFVHAPGKYVCLCGDPGTSSGRADWLGNFTRMVQQQRRHFPLDLSLKDRARWAYLTDLAACAVRRASLQPDYRDLLTPQRDQASQWCHDALSGLGSVVVRDYDCPGLRAGESCTPACRQQNDEYVAASSDALFINGECYTPEGCSGQYSAQTNLTYVKQLNFWAFLEQQACPDTPNARWCHAASSLRTLSGDSFSFWPAVAPLCAVPPGSSVVLAIGSIFGYARTCLHSSLLLSSCLPAHALGGFVRLRWCAVC